MSLSVDAGHQGHQFAQKKSVFAPLPWLATFAILVLALVQRVQSPTNHDVAWLITAAGRILDGSKIFVDVIEVNPPLIIWLMTPGVALGRVLDLGPAIGFYLTVFGAALVSVALCAWLIRRFELSRNLYVVPLIAFMLMIFPARDFGQREHLMVIFILPYLLLTACRALGRDVDARIAVPVALFGGLGILLKPYFVAFPALLEFYLLYTIGFARTLKRVEPYVLVAGGLTYLALIWFVTPQYFSVVLTYASEVYHLGYSDGFVNALVRAVFILVVAMAVTKILSTLGVDKQERAIFAVLFVAAAAGCVSYFLQLKGWGYHMIPTRTFLILIALWAVLRAPLDNLFMTLRKPGYALATVLVSIVAISAVLKPEYRKLEVDQRIAQLAAHPDAKSVFVFSGNVFQGNTMALDKGLEWASRFPTLWLMPGLVLKREQMGGTTPLLDEIERYNWQSVTEDLTKWKPDLIFVDVNEKKSHFQNARYDYIANFSQHPPFAALWKEYRLDSTADGFALYVRKSASTGG